MTVRRAQVGQRSETVRRANLAAIVRELRAGGAFSRSELVERTGLTRSTIRGLIGELAAAGFVVEERGVSSGTRGRPSPVVRPRAEGAAVIALEIAVDSLAVAVVGLGGHVLESERVDRPRGHLSVDDTVTDLRTLADVVLARGPRPDRLVAIGVAVVGIVRRADGFVSTAPNLGWRDVPLGERLVRAFPLGVPILVGNEADLGALAEYRRGAGLGVENMVFVSGEVGVGGGLIVDGKPLVGVAGYGGEVGHLPVNPVDGARCRCGSIGCWETEVGEGALLARAGYPVDGGRAAVDAVMAEARSGTASALAAVDEVGRWLGIGLAGLVNLLDPSLVVLGGRLERLYPLVAARIEAELDARALPAPRGLVRIAPAALGVDAPLFGAAELAFEQFHGDPGAWLTPAMGREANGTGALADARTTEESMPMGA